MPIRKIRAIKRITSGTRAARPSRTAVARVSAKFRPRPAAGASKLGGAARAAGRKARAGARGFAKAAKPKGLGRRLVQFAKDNPKTTIAAGAYGAYTGGKKGERKKQEKRRRY